MGEKGDARRHQGGAHRRFGALEGGIVRRLVPGRDGEAQAGAGDAVPLCQQREEAVPPGGRKRQIDASDISRPHPRRCLAAGAVEAEIDPPRQALGILFRQVGTQGAREGDTSLIGDIAEGAADPPEGAGVKAGDGLLADRRRSLPQ